jgi:hypothetical protein
MNNGVSQAHIVCPKCNAEHMINVERYVSIAKHPEKKQSLLKGDLGVHRCSCGFAGIVSIPMIYNDEKKHLCVFICDGDRDTLVDEFHALLTHLRPLIGDSEYNSILQRPFQIIIGLAQVARVVYALDHDVYCYRMSPGLSEAPTFDDIFFLIAAKYYRLINRHDAAFAIARVPFDFGYRSPRLLRELGAYAFSVNKLDEAEEFLLATERRRKELSHVWEQIVVPEGMVTKISDEVALKNLSESIKPSYQQLRPECGIDNYQLSRIAGTLLAIFDNAIKELNLSGELILYQGFIEHKVEQFLKNEADEKEILTTIIKETKGFVHRRMEADDWPMVGLTKA